VRGTTSSCGEGSERPGIARARLGKLRLEAVAALSRGESASVIAQSLGVSVRTVQRWTGKLRDLGQAALEGPVWPGKSARLAPELIAQLAQDLTRTPHELDYAQIHWTAPLLSRHIRGRFGVRVGDRQCLRILRQAGVPRNGGPSKPLTNATRKPATEGNQSDSAKRSQCLSDRQLKDRALERIRRLASSGLPLVPFASTLFDLTSDAVPQTEGIRGICADVHRHSWFFQDLDYLKWEPAIRKYAMQDDPAESGIVPQDRRDRAVTVALSFEQMVFPDFHKLAGYHELYRHLHAHHFIGALLGQGDALGMYTLWRDETMRPFSNADLHFLEAAAPHISHAIKAARLLSVSSSLGNDVQSQANGRLGVILMSFEGKVLALNQEAERLFHQLGVFDRLRANTFAVGIGQALDYIASTMRAIFQEIGNSKKANAPAVRIFPHPSGITLSMRGFVTDGNPGQKCFVVLIEQGELHTHRRLRIMHRYGLSSREAELLGLLRSGLPARDIAGRMGLGTGTVKTYASRLADKLEVPTLAALRAFAREQQI
jgi:transposase